MIERKPYRRGVCPVLLDYWTREGLYSFVFYAEYNRSTWWCFPPLLCRYWMWLIESVLICRWTPEKTKSVIWVSDKNHDASFDLHDVMMVWKDRPIRLCHWNGLPIGKVTKGPPDKAKPLNWASDRDSLQGLPELASDKECDCKFDFFEIVKVSKGPPEKAKPLRAMTAFVDRRWLFVS